MICCEVALNAREECLSYVLKVRPKKEKKRVEAFVSGMWAQEALVFGLQ